MNLQPHQQRLLEERSELEEKLARLTAFFGTKTYAALSDAERSRLRCQSFFMVGYAAVLGDRINAMET